MLQLIILSLNHFFHSLVRQLYWLYRLSYAKLGKRIKLQFPLIVEGKGNLIIGSNASIKKRASFKIATQGSLEFGNGAIIEAEVDFRISSNASLIMGKDCGIGMRSRIFVNTCWKLDNNVKIATNCQIFAREPNMQGKLIIGEGCRIGDNTIIDVSDDVVIGSKVAFGPNCVLYTHDHNYKTDNMAAWEGPLKLGKILIEDGAWIGSSVTILPGVIIGKRAVIAAGSVVTKDIPSNTVVGGVPAKFLKIIM